MTKRVVVANLSNWDGEDFEMQITRNCDGRIERETHLLRPGEHCDVLSTYGAAKVDIIDRQRDTPPTKPFHITAGRDEELEHQGQTFPKMSIEWESNRGQTKPIGASNSPKEQA